MRQHSDHSPKGRNFDVYPRMDPDLFEEDLDGVDEERRIVDDVLFHPLFLLLKLDAERKIVLQ